MNINRVTLFAGHYGSGKPQPPQARAGDPGILFPFDGSEFRQTNSPLALRIDAGLPAAAERTEL